MIKKIGVLIGLILFVWVMGTYTNVFESSKTLDTQKKIIETEMSVEVSDNIETKTMKAILKTNKGDIEITFDDRTPNTVENFIKLAKLDLYNGTKFHRVIKGFMIQGGDPLSKDDNFIDRWGTGGPGYQFDDEIHESNNNIIGSISMANSGPNTNGSQFFINTADNVFLNDKHTVFGNVSAGVDVIKAIENVETQPDDKPVEPVIIQSIELIEG